MEGREHYVLHDVTPHPPDRDYLLSPGSTRSVR
ncbi:hypothetical protein EAJSRFBN_CDS0211 [Salmonella phage SeKF_19]